MRSQSIASYDDVLTSKIIGAAIETHKFLGPCLLESVYEDCFAFELSRIKLKVDRQVQLPIIYKGVKTGGQYRVDLIVENEVVVEIKSVSDFLSVHEAQLLSYLKLRGGGRGLLINFNVPLLRDGIRRFKV